ncbi:TPA: hypothetical protein ENS27_14270 [bacterium]|nr:hypothetical protein [bacterium]
MKQRFKIIEIVIMLVMLFGWFSMLSKIILADYYELYIYNPVSYGFIIFLIAMPVFVIISARKTLNEWLSIGLIVFGMLSLCQPFTMVLYKCGFQTLLGGTLGFIIASHK